MVEFRPELVPEGTCKEGNFADISLADALLRLGAGRMTGRFSTHDDTGDNHLFFMQGKPVGVQLAELHAPLGQLLLEMGLLDGKTFLRAHREIVRNRRLSGQVYQELGVLTEESLRSLLHAQARRKVERFCRTHATRFSFCHGLTFLVGFPSTSLQLPVLIYFAMRHHPGPEDPREQLRLWSHHTIAWKSEENDVQGMPVSAGHYGLSDAEMAFLERLRTPGVRVGDAVEQSALSPRVALILLQYLQKMERLALASAEQESWIDLSLQMPASSRVAADFLSPLGESALEIEVSPSGLHLETSLDDGEPLLPESSSPKQPTSGRSSPTISADRSGNRSEVRSGVVIRDPRGEKSNKGAPGTLSPTIHEKNKKKG